MPDPFKKATRQANRKIRHQSRVARRELRRTTRANERFANSEAIDANGSNPYMPAISSSIDFASDMVGAFQFEDTYERSYGGYSGDDFTYDLGDDISQIGAIGEGMTLENLHAAAQNIDPSTGILDLEVDGQPRWETARKFYNSIADTKFPDPNARSMGTGRPAERRALYQETVDTVRRYADEANEEAAQEAQSHSS